jgi:pyruvate,water dikinase
MTKKFVVWFQDVDREDGAIVGGKGANLGEMTKAGFPVPPGFIVTAQAYYHFLDEANLRPKIHEALDKLDVSDSKALDKAALKAQHIILHAPFPKDIGIKIMESYFSLGGGVLKHPLVAVRSSATAEDLPGASFAGQQATFLNVEGEANVIEKVKEAWASLFTSRAIFYRVTQKFDHFKVGIAVPVQKMVTSHTSGIMFTIDPVTSDKSKVVIEAIYGLGEMIVQGSVTPDHYEVDKKSKEIIAKTVQRQEKMMFKRGRDNVIVKVKDDIAHRQKLTDKQILALAEIGKKLERHYYFPQDSEWAIEDDVIYIVQTRPVTTVGKFHEAVKESGAKKEVLVTGDPASPGMASGPVKILKSASELNKVLPGDVLVAEMTNPDYVPAMKKAVAILTQRGGRTSHAAIVSRELGIPAVVGAGDVMKKVKDGMVITVNGSLGEVYKGAVAGGAQAKGPAAVVDPSRFVKTATKVYVNLGEPDLAAKFAARNVDGVGLLRAEFMMVEIGTHPKKFIADKKQHVFIDELAKGMETICSAFNPRPVVYRASDFRTNEFRNLKGGDLYEPKEENPMLGFRGAARYIADPRVFEMELSAIKEVRNQKGLKNLHLMIPFVRSPKELLEVKKIVSASGLARSSNFKLWMMCELPTNVVLIEQFLDVGIDGISFGSNDLTMLMLGCDRDNSEIAHAYNEIDDSLLWAYERVIKACNKRGVTTSMCGQAPSNFPELVEKLVSWGATSMSVNIDVVDNVRDTVSAAEKKLITRK